MDRWSRRFHAARRRRALRERAIAHLGGQCAICGYQGSPVAYDFHHLDPAEKDFTISDRMTSFEAIRKELEKCALLCARCHREVHDGYHPSYLAGEDHGAYGLDEGSDVGEPGRDEVDGDIDPVMLLYLGPEVAPGALPDAFVADTALVDPDLLAVGRDLSVPPLDNTQGGHSADLHFTALLEERGSQNVLALHPPAGVVLTSAGRGLLGPVDLDHVPPATAAFDEEDVGRTVAGLDVGHQGDGPEDASLQVGVLDRPGLGQGVDDLGAGGEVEGGGHGLASTYPGGDQTEMEEFWSGLKIGACEESPKRASTSSAGRARRATTRRLERA